VAGFVVDDAGGTVAAFGGGRSGPLMPHAASVASSAATHAARSARARID